MLQAAMPELPEVEAVPAKPRTGDGAETVQAGDRATAGSARALPAPFRGPAGRQDRPVGRPPGQVPDDSAVVGRHAGHAPRDVGLVRDRRRAAGSGGCPSRSRRLPHVVGRRSSPSTIRGGSGSWISWTPRRWSAHPVLSKLGPEPLSPEFDASALARACKGKKTPLKVALLDQRVVAGLGKHLRRRGASPGRPVAGAPGVDDRDLVRARRRRRPDVSSPRSSRC